MNPFTPLDIEQRIIYPDSDGEPIGENTLQFRWIVTIQGNLDALFASRADVFVAGDLFWYPVRGAPAICTAPDVLSVFGRPKRERLSYLQWLEENVAPQVVWEILSPGNRATAMAGKLEFYERYGVEEYYIYDPDSNVTRGWQRSGERLREIPSLAGWVSPRLQIRFELGADALELYRPDGRPFLTFVELAEQASAEQQRADSEADRADAESLRADSAEKRAALEAQRAQVAAERAAAAELRASLGQQEALASRERAERLAQQLRALGIDPNDS